MKKTLSFLLLGASLALGARTNAQVVFSEDFEASTGSGSSGFTFPTGWTQNVTPNDSVGFRSGTATGLASTGFNFNDHTRFVGVNDDAHQFASNSDVMIITPSITMPASSAGTPYLNFACCYRNGTYGGFTEAGTVEVSTDGGSTWTVVSTLSGNAMYWWEPRYINLSAYSGMNIKIGFRYKDNTGWLYGLCIDDVKVFIPPANELALTSLAPATGAPASYALGGNNITLSGTVMNNGASTVTSYNVKYIFNGGSVVTVPVSGSIAPFASSNFNLTASPITMPTSLGAYPVRAWVELAGDADASNDSSATQQLNTVMSFPTKRIVFEEGTGTWCGWCVRGIVFMDSLYHMYGNGVSLVAVHNGDPMVVTAYDTWMGGQIGGYPSAVADRSTELDPSEMLTYYNQHNSDFGFAAISATGTVAGTAVSIPVTVTPALNLSGDYRLVVALTEYDLKGTTSGWNQANYYSGGGSGAMSGGGVNYATMPNPIPAAQMEYDHVARAINPSVTGTAGSLPATMTAGTAYTATLTATLNSSWNKDKMKAIVMMLDNATGRVMNSYGFNLGAGLSVNNVNNDVNEVSIYPNPTANDVNVMFSLEKATEVSLAVIDVTGRVVANVGAQSYNAGNNNVAINVANLANGIYTVRIATAESTITRQLSVQK